jgi:hypothetical protein
MRAGVTSPQRIATHFCVMAECARLFRRSVLPMESGGPGSRIGSEATRSPPVGGCLKTIFGGVAFSEDGE